MAIFPKKNSSIIDNNWNNMFEALESLASNEDTPQKITFNFKDSESNIYIYKNKVYNLTHKPNDFSVPKRAFWSENVDNHLLNELNNNSDSNDFENYFKFVSLFPNFKDKLEEYYTNLSIETAQYIHNNYSDVVSLEKNVWDDYSDDSIFMEIELETLADELDSLNSEENVYRSKLFVNDSSMDEVKLSLLTKDYLAENDTQRFVIGAAENKANLEQINELAGGFISAEVFMNVYELADTGVIKVESPAGVIEKDFNNIVKENPVLPTLTEEVLDDNSSLDEELIEENIIEEDNLLEKQIKFAPVDEIIKNNEKLSDESPEDEILYSLSTEDSLEEELPEFYIPIENNSNEKRSGEEPIRTIDVENNDVLIDNQLFINNNKELLEDIEVVDNISEDFELVNTEEKDGSNSFLSFKETVSEVISKEPPALFLATVKKLGYNPLD